jgi:hypothetical protein
MIEIVEDYLFDQIESAIMISDYEDKAVAEQLYANLMGWA